MTKTTLQLACAVLFCIGHAAHADTTANSSSGSTSGSSSVGIGQGGGSSLNNIGTSANSSASTNSASSSVGGIGSANAQGGSSNVNVSVTMPAMTASNGTSGSGTGTTGSTGSTPDATTKATTPGSSPYDTRATVDYNQSSYSVRTTPSIAAPSLTTTLSDTCMGSASFGISVTGFGATGGTTMVDQACVRRLDAREFRAMGLTDVALALLCQSDSNRRAVEATGHLCPGTTAPLAKTGDGATLSDDEKYRDPIVRARLGLPVTAANDPAVQMKSQRAPEVKKDQAPARPLQSEVAEVKTIPVEDRKIEVSLVK
ncbi:hypothetical protein [Caballeronia humi]|jgi:hypothetical protein|uniref:Chemotaxis protein CheA n=1 Tax=Caballeronia humi TaxID=326474 RepID=A0A158IPZ7_9BURK|nr:hypothetical protein [Caballeronia humi]SAL58608.1 chemotaxis protein CheA [Caballeronia humi]